MMELHLPVWPLQVTKLRLAVKGDIAITSLPSKVFGYGACWHGFVMLAL